MAIFSRKKNDGPRRQWGADSNIDPMPQVPRIAGDWTMTIGRAAVVFTVAAWIALVVSVVNGQVIEGVAGHASLTETVGFLTAVSLLAASAIAYLFGRLGFYYRTKEGRRTPRAMLDEFYAERRPGVTALIPSYQEEPGVILMTLLSTALQEYPDLRVVLLVDDPPNPRYAGPRRLLDSA
jgi:cellulose synthase (UDP-forming)